MENKKINIKKEYKNIIIYNEKLRDIIADLKEKAEERRKSYNLERIKNLTTEQLEEENRQEKQEAEQLKKAELEQNLLINNLLFIQQELLKESFEIYKTKYINKKIGEKTAEKIKEDLESYILNTYDLEIHFHIKSDLDYNGNTKVKIYLYYKDFYYIYELKQEEMHYIKETEENYLYYYRQVDYIPLKSVENKAIKIIEDYKKNIEKLDFLEKQQKKLIDNNNNNLPVIIEKYRIKQGNYYY